jgi:hypothetical protein
MAVKGLDQFRKHFAGHADSFVLIGGAACDLWFTSQDLGFRSTADLDIVLLLEAIRPDFVEAFWRFVRDAGYQRLECTEGQAPRLYRFAKPANLAYPKMLELLSRLPDDLILRERQEIVPIRLEETPSLSAILLHPPYYDFLRAHVEVRDGLPTADVNALVLFKARAWLDLTERKEKGETISSTDIDKHRNDVFRLAATLSTPLVGGLVPELSVDLRRFLEAFPVGDPAWIAIQQALKASRLGPILPAILLQALTDTFL